MTLATAVLQNPLTRFIKYFSSWNKLVRSIAWLLKFKTYLILKGQKSASGCMSIKPGHADQQLSAQDLSDAQEPLVTYARYQTFRDEVCITEEPSCEEIVDSTS